MPIDSCPHSFENLASTVLPDHFRRLKTAIAAPLPCKKLIGYNSGTKVLLGSLDMNSDISGCYVFIESGKPIYVGISRRVINRLVQHLNADTHHSASLTYNMAKAICHHEKRRGEAMTDPAFYAAFVKAQARLRKMHVAFIEIQNDLEIYLFEAYAAMKLDTGKWNSFRTH